MQAHSKKRETKIRAPSLPFPVRRSRRSSSKPAWAKERKGRGSPHETRPDVNGPVHVTLKICRGLPNLRTPRAYPCSNERSERARRRSTSGSASTACSDHLHLIVEANERRALARGMQGLAIRIAKALNKHWHGRKGSVFSERYFARALVKPMEVWRALRYVLNNARKHGEWASKSLPDPFSSGRWFRRWEGRWGQRMALRSPPLAIPRHFLTHFGERWSIRIDEVPGTSCFRWIGA